MLSSHNSLSIRKWSGEGNVDICSEWWWEFANHKDAGLYEKNVSSSSHMNASSLRLPSFAVYATIFYHYGPTCFFYILQKVGNFRNLCHRNSPIVTRSNGRLIDILPDHIFRRLGSLPSISIPFFIHILHFHYHHPSWTIWLDTFRLLFCRTDVQGEWGVIQNFKTQTGHTSSAPP